ncbi:DUF4253 domain-containing protein [Catellatospora sp. KI3]|uniref:DUF4253 domain-containing protein n=1 Tax=Catellatospora sp. KI3 TaxID=3041620 RepID=UPI0024823157|nr:DUF4253 domain-containing protein [Catellatospora sp. KI3]MDI1462044.1 DUF4253 domain-containing protein [Catellatospora sp. KI3]
MLPNRRTPINNVDVRAAPRFGGGQDEPLRRLLAAQPQATRGCVGIRLPSRGRSAGAGKGHAPPRPAIQRPAARLSAQAPTLPACRPEHPARRPPPAAARRPGARPPHPVRAAAGRTPGDLAVRRRPGVLAQRRTARARPLGPAARRPAQEQRFGARVVTVGSGTLGLSVAAPPGTEQEALAVAAEHFACCSELVYQDGGTIGTYADEIRTRTSWRFWWD